MLTEEVYLDFEGISVGVVRQSFQSDGTWYGTVELVIDASEGAKYSRVLEYIAFCEDWNERVRNGARTNASEFDQFRDVVSEGLWRARRGGAEKLISNAPVFFKGGEVSWIEEGP